MRHDPAAPATATNLRLEDTSPSTVLLLLLVLVVPVVQVVLVVLVVQVVLVVVLTAPLL